MAREQLVDPLLEFYKRPYSGTIHERQSLAGTLLVPDTSLIGKANGRPYDVSGSEEVAMGPTLFVGGCLIVAAFLLIVFACGSTTPQEEAATETEIPENEYGLEVIDDKDLYLQTVAEDLSKEFVDLEEEIPGIRLDIRYATTGNFMRVQLYPVAKAYLRAPAADSLGAVQQDLKERGLELKVFDAYRPYEVTEKIWEPYQDPNFVADPTQGSRHNRGCAVDVTLVDANGEELLMPTGYDDFSQRAGHDFQDLPEEAIRNRDLLREVMESHDFEALPTEWWHYDYQGWERFEVMDLPLDSVPRAA